MRKRLFIHDEADNVAVALFDLKGGETVEIEIREKPNKVEILGNIPYGHKVALDDIEEGEKVIKYGETIGVATGNIPKGSHAHTHNIRSLRY